MVKCLLLDRLCVHESAIDHGGLRKEFFRLLAIRFGKVLMIGSDSSKFMLPDVKALQVKLICLLMYLLNYPYRTRTSIRWESIL